jgi:hypothetical protein
MTPAELIEAYLKLRTKITTVETRHKEEILPYTKLKTEIETALLAHLNELGLESTKCKAGTAYKSTTTSVTVKDWPSTLAFIRENELWDLLEARVGKTVALELLEERGEPPPGVQITQALVLRVRAS